ELRPPDETRLSTPHHLCGRPVGGGTAAPRAPRGRAPETVAAWDPSRRRHPGSSRLLPRRIHVPVQPAHLPASRQVVLSAGAAGPPPPTRAPPGPPQNPTPRAPPAPGKAPPPKRGTPRKGGGNLTNMGK